MKGGRILTADNITLQLCEARTSAFTRPGWVFELKFDGFRLLAERIDGRVRMLLRRGREATALFPEIAQALGAIHGPDFILDGELVIQDAVGAPVFRRLLKRSTLVSAPDIQRAARLDPSVYFAFDLLMLEGDDLRDRPLAERKRLLFELLADAQHARIVPVTHIEEEGERLLDLVRAKGLEGIVAKRLDSPYRGGRSSDWVKIALTQTGDFAVVGYAADWGALFLATWDDGRFVYAGKVGSGFTPKRADAVKPVLQAQIRKKAPCIGELPRDNDVIWCEPKLVAEVRYKTWPDGLSPREPVFLRFRDDKAPQECLAPTSRTSAVASSSSTGPSAPLPVARSGVSNPRKIYFPEDGITKAEVVAYYEAVAPWMLPYLADRPLVLTRYPDGIYGKWFFQTHAPPKVPDCVRTERLWSEEQGQHVEQIVCDNAATLVWCANLGAIPMHIPAARLASPLRPDWAIIDFDPKEAPFAHVIELATTVRSWCEAVGLPSFAKTSGASGLHVLFAIGGQLDFEGARQLVQLFARMLLSRHPRLCTLERTVSKRGGKVYLDLGQNAQGKVIAAPLCVRPHPTAPVSMPVPWSEVRPGLTSRSFTLRNALERLERLGDPMVEILTAKPDFRSILGRLEKLKATG